MEVLSNLLLICLYYLLKVILETVAITIPLISAFYTMKFIIYGGKRKMEEKLTKKRDYTAFMMGKAKDVETVEQVVSKRYLDENGNPIPFEFRPISSKRIEELQKQCTEPIKRKGRVIDEKVDYGRFGARLGIETTTYPNFKDADLLSSYGLVDPVDLVKEILSVGGEYAEWIRVVQEVNGFDEDFEELVQEAKN